MVNFEYQERYGYEDLLKIMALLRSEDGCPWDREQTHESIRRNFIEEVYEACEAIDLKDPAHLREELGDVLLQIVFHAQMEAERGVFTMDDVCDEICKKLVVRHPHIFGSIVVRTSGEVLTNWDAIKRETKGQKSTGEAMDAVAKILPSLIRAEKVQAKAAKAGFDRPGINGALDKIEEETGELREACEHGGDAEEELGDLLFSAVWASRFLNADPELLLSRTVDKFTARFRFVEKAAAAEGKKLENLTQQELDALWERAKAALAENKIIK